MADRHHLVLATLAEVERLRPLDFNGPDELVLQLLQSYPSEQSLADLLWGDLPNDASVQVIADLLSLWTWRTSDNGSQIMRTVERWIDECVNSKQIAVALNLDGYPFIDDHNRMEKLQQVADKFPDLKPRCLEIINQTRKWIERNAVR
jgi:hypothetical protein